MSFTQLEIYPTPDPIPSVTVNPLTSSYTHGIVKNAVQRGVYYRYWWIDADGVTHGRYIRGGAVGTEIGEVRKLQVLTLIDAGCSPYQIGQFLDRLPRSQRRSRHVDFQKYMETKN